MRRLGFILLVVGSWLSGCGESPIPASGSAMPPLEITPPTTYWLPSLKAERLEAQDDRRADCRRQLGVELSVSGERITGAMISDEADGSCESPVAANKRFYELRMVTLDCGSRVYKGVLVAAEGPSSLTLIDHSQRRCKGNAHTLELTERNARGATRRYGGHY